MSTKVKISTPTAQLTPIKKAHLQRHFLSCVSSYLSHGDITTEINRRLQERLQDIKTHFPQVLNLGAGLIPLSLEGSQIMRADLTPFEQNDMIFNAEHPFPLKDNSTDLIYSNLMLPWITHIDVCLYEIKRCLKPDGLFLASTLGESSFQEFQHCFAQAGIQTPCTLPLPDIKTVGKALQQTGFTLPVVDRDILTLQYENFDSLYQDFKYTGCRNLNPQRAKGLLTPRKLKQIETLYRKNFGHENYIPVTLEVLYLHGWKADSSQPQPLSPGTARQSFADIL